MCNSREYAIRRAEPGDALQLHALITDHAEFERGQATIGLHDLNKLLAEDSRPTEILVAARRGCLLGYTAVTFDFSLWRGQRWAHLDCMFVREDARGQAVGAALLAHAKEIARSSGADRLEGQTPDWNSRGIVFYEREGASIAAKARFHFSLCAGSFPSKPLDTRCSERILPIRETIIRSAS